MQNFMKQNSGNEAERHDEYKMMPKVFKKADPFFAFYKKPKSSSQAETQNTSANVSQKKLIPEEPKVKQQEKNVLKDKPRSSHSKKNPINPIKQSIKLLDQFGKNINEDYSAFVNFTKSLNEQRHKDGKQPQIRLDECLTLKVIKKLSNGGCIKKVLNVPTFKIFLLEQRPINNNDSKHTIQKELEKWNSCPRNTYQLKNVKLFWNTPEEFVSLLHQYVHHYSLQSVLSVSNNLSEQALAEKMVEVIHMVSLFEKEGVKFPKLSSEEILVSLSGGGIKVKPSIMTGMEQTKLENSMTYQIAKWIETDNQKMRLPLRIGLLALYLGLGNFVMQEEVGEKIFNLYDTEIDKNQNKVGCCLLHRLDDYKDQLVLFSSNKRKWSRNLQDFLCKCLSFDRKKRMDLQQIKKHSFITRVEQIQKVSFTDILQVVNRQNQPVITTEIEINYRLQLNKISDAIRMILSNNSIKHRVQLPIKDNDPTIAFIEEDICLGKGTLMERLNRAYADFK